MLEELLGVLGLLNAAVDLGAAEVDDLVDLLDGDLATLLLLDEVTWGRNDDLTVALITKLRNKSGFTDE